jgi:hypothetical protein
MLKDLLENYPNTAALVKNWLLEKLLESLKTDSVPDDFKEYARQQGIEDDHVVGILENNPRSLFDLFDEYSIFITIEALSPENFSVRINGVNGGDRFTSRIDADRSAISEAFKLLNDKP